MFPILVVYFIKSGLSGTEIGLVFSIGVYTAFFLELPSGYISDKLGHRHAITICFIMKALAMLCYLGGTFWWFVLAEALFVGGGALWSGTGEAFLFETAKDLGRSDDFAKLYGGSTAFGLYTSSVYLLFMPFLYMYNNDLVFYINFILMLIPLTLSLTLKQPSYIKSVAKIEGWWGVVHEWRIILKFILVQKKYRTLIFFYSFWQAVQDSIDLFGQVYFSYLKIPTQYFGIVQAVNRVSQAVGGQIAHHIKSIMSPLKILALLSIELVSFFIFGAYANQYLGMLIFPVRNFFEGVSDPISSNMINKEITKGYRMTFLSIGPTLRRLIQGALVFILGSLFDIFSVPQVFLISGVSVAIILSLLYMSAARTLAPKEA